MKTTATAGPLGARAPAASGPAVHHARPRHRDLEADLRAALDGEVRFDDGSRALYATDASNYRQVPIGVVVPRHVEDIVRTVAVARGHAAPIVMRGGGTSLAGQSCNAAVLIDTSKHVNRPLEVDADRRRARVEPGTILDHLRRETAGHGLTFGPDPATHTHCVLGGMIGNNSCGVHSVHSEFYGPGPRTADNVERLEVLTYDGLRLTVGPTSAEELERIIRAGGRRGEIYRGLRDLRDRYAGLIRERFPDIPRRVSGYNLPQLLPEHGFNLARALVGSEGTCAVTLEATLSLLHNPPKRCLVVLGYPSVYEAGDHIMEVRAHKPVGLEGMDDLLVAYMRRKELNAAHLGLLPEGGGWLLVEVGGESQAEAHDAAERLVDAVRRGGKPPSVRILDDPAQQSAVWDIRESGLGATAFVPGEPDAWPGWEDSAVPPERLGDYLRDFRALLERHGYQASLYGHFGQACLHTRIDFDLTSAGGIAGYRRFTLEAADLVTRYGGVLSGEHGDGQARGDLLPRLYGAEGMQALREFKRIWDPDGKMNPGKAVDAKPRDANLRLGTGYRPRTPRTHFRFPADEGSFARAALRCVGVGKCRRTEGATMCPSFMVLREEKHTTRGRAHLLFEMLRGEVIRDGWRSEEVKEALDLCLACKGCKGDCPVNVDVATYKAEFLSHYYAGRLRPRHAYAFGLIHWWARLASLAPGLVNAAAQAPGLSAMAKAMAGMSQERSIPPFARQTFRRWFGLRRGDGRPGARGEVILWPDTFTNHFLPRAGIAAVEVLEAAGYRVRIPAARLCCGRPLYDYGMLDRAKALLRQVLTALREDIRAGVPLVGLEPSCVAVFRDELTDLFPHDEDAQRLKRQTFLLSEFLEQDDYRPPPFRRRALVHAHCHHKAVMGVLAEQGMLERLGLDFTLLNAGCCGMAGSFGFEAEKYGVSMAVGERALLPAVREADAGTLIVANGFSCREQIRQATGREALHLAEVLAMAHRETAAQPARGRYPLPDRARQAALVGGAALLAAVLITRGQRRRA